MDFYKDRVWENLREQILRRDKYMCRISHRTGKIVEAEVVHHIFPLEEFPEYALEPWNLISLCRKEHNRLHDRNTNELTEAGRELLLKTARQNNVEVPEKYKKTVKHVVKHERRNLY